LSVLYTFAFPSLGTSDNAFIEGFRAEHQAEQSQVVAAHFTMVFGCAIVSRGEYLQHVRTVAEASSSVRFSCRYAMLGADDQDYTAYVFLVPNAGFAELSLLHDRLYTGVLSSHLRLDLPFIPHITIGRLAERRAAKGLCDALNGRGVDIEGRVEALTVGLRENGKIQDLARFELRT
jgi:2'-5' RNA ligase